MQDLEMYGGLGGVTLCEDWEVYLGLGIVGLVEDFFFTHTRQIKFTVGGEKKKLTRAKKIKINK